ncbi:DUF3105 domain-containing protein [Actinomadura flavalba]|uniref:DUF3105 domain-containing protein n=1 Tax=Actinomadura flavalba TaxID=1120938 RepID=UPI0003635B4B|nr:DUF3105 domain-containing protein [Actinomadura flavalba]
MSKSTRNRAQQQRKNALTERHTPWGGIIFFTVIGLVAAVAVTFAYLSSRPPSTEIAGLVEKDGLADGHTTSPVQYDASPPMGGDHDPAWQSCDARVYDRPLRNENAVHSLEHGAVWITHRPDLHISQLAALSQRVKAVDYTMMSPYPDLDSPIVLTAWGRQLKVDDASDPRIGRFLQAFVKGPQTPEKGAPCNGGKETA